MKYMYTDFLSRWKKPPKVLTYLIIFVVSLVDSAQCELFKCSDCDADFALLEHLNKHILSEHPTQIEQTAYRKKFDKIIEAEEEYHDYIKGQLISECLLVS